MHTRLRVIVVLLGVLVVLVCAAEESVSDGGAPEVLAPAADGGSPATPGGASEGDSGPHDSNGGAPAVDDAAPVAPGAASVRSVAESAPNARGPVTGGVAPASDGGMSGSSALTGDVESIDLASLSMQELSLLEERLTREVAENDAALEALRRDTDKLREEQEQIDLDAAALSEAREEEARRKEERDRELAAAKKDVLAKQTSIARMSVRVTELKEQISMLEGKLQVLLREKEETERRYNDPSLVDVLESRSENWGQVQRNIYNKTMHEIVPAISQFSDVAGRYRAEIGKKSRALEFLASVLVYGFVIASGYFLRTVYKSLRGKLTVSRMLFLGDGFCACFWVVILVCYMFLLSDPLRVIQRRSPRAFFLFQLVTLSSYVGYVMLRVLVLASHLTLSALGEVLGVIVIGQHYYVRVWQPALLNQHFGGTFVYYLCYAAMFLAFAVKRVEEFIPLKRVQGRGIPLMAMLRVVYSRLTKKHASAARPPPEAYIPVHAGDAVEAARSPLAPVTAK